MSGVSNNCAIYNRYLVYHEYRRNSLLGEYKKYIEVDVVCKLIDDYYDEYCDCFPVEEFVIGHSPELAAIVDSYTKKRRLKRNQWKVYAEYVDKLYKLQAQSIMCYINTLPDFVSVNSCNTSKEFYDNNKVLFRIFFGAETLSDITFVIYSSDHLKMQIRKTRLNTSLIGTEGKFLLPQYNNSLLTKKNIMGLEQQDGTNIKTMIVSINSGIEVAIGTKLEDYIFQALLNDGQTLDII